MGIFRTQVIPRIQELVQWFKSLSPEVREQALVFAGLAAAIGPVLLVLGAVVGALAAIASPVGLVAVAVAALAAAWITNFGGIRDRVEPILDRLGFAFRFLKSLIEPLVPAFKRLMERIGPALQEVATLLGPAFGKAAELVGNHIQFMIGILGRFASFNLTIWGFIGSVIERIVREIGAIFERLQPVFEAFGTWVNDHVWRPLLEFLSWVQGVIGGLGLPGVGDIGNLVREGELALARQAGEIRAGGPGARQTNVEVTINNPQVQDQTMLEQIVAQAKHELTIALVMAEDQSEIPPSPGLPGQPIMPFTRGPF
jgi:phage-related protein